MDTVFIFIMVVMTILGGGSILHDWFLDSSKKTQPFSDNIKINKSNSCITRMNGIFSSAVLAIASWVMNNHSDPVDEESVRETGKEIAQNSVYLDISKNILS